MSGPGYLLYPVLCRLPSPGSIAGAPVSYLISVQFLLHSTMQQEQCAGVGLHSDTLLGGLRLLKETKKAFPVIKWRESNFTFLSASLVEKKELVFILMLTLNGSSF